MADFAALALARRALAHVPARYPRLAARSPGAAATMLESDGHAAPGKGAARYLCDALATPELVAAHPRFAFVAGDGRCFRLLPEAGSLSVEQGGASGDGITDDRAAIQAALDYAAAIGAREVRFESARYRIHCPPRSSPADAVRAEDGRPLVVRASIALRGCAPDRSVLDFRGVGGADPDAGWQVVATSASDPAPAVWRGGGILLLGDATDPAPAPRRIARFSMERLVLAGNRTRQPGLHDWPADPATGGGWDTSDKALWVQDCYVGALALTDCDLVGWRGEILYLGGADRMCESLTLTRCRLATTNGSALNPGCDALVSAVDCEFGDAMLAQEDPGKTRAAYRNCRWFDCEKVWIGGGGIGDDFHSYAWPTRDPARPVPATMLADCRFEDCGLVIVNSWVTGRITTVDCMVLFDTTTSLAIRDTDLDIDAWVDRGGSRHALAIAGPDRLDRQVPGLPEGIFYQPPRNLRIRLRHVRSSHAEAQGYQCNGVEWGGLIDASCRIAVEGEHGNERTPHSNAPVLSMPLVSFAGPASSTGAMRGWRAHPSLAGSGTLTPDGPLMSLGVVGDGALEALLPAVPAGGYAFGYAEGQRLSIVKAGANGSIAFVKGASAAMAMQATRVLAAEYDRIDFTYNRTLARWEEAGFLAAG